MGGATFRRIVNKGFRELAARQAEENPNATGVLGRFFVEVGKKEKAAKKKAAAASADRPAKAGRAAMAAPGAVEYAGEDTDEATPRRRRRQVRGRPTAARRRSLLAEQSDSEMKTRLGG